MDLEKIFKYKQCIIAILILRTWPFMLRNMSINYLHQRMERILNSFQINFTQVIFFKFRHCIFSTCSFLSLQNDIPLHLNKWESPLPKVLCAKLNSYRKSMLCAKNDWNWSKGSGEEDENVYKQTNGLTTDNRRSKSQFQLKRAIQVAANPYKHLTIVSSIIGWKL